MHLDAHEKPPSWLKTVFKRYQKNLVSDVDEHRGIFDGGPNPVEMQSDGLKKVQWQEKSAVDAALSRFLSSETSIETTGAFTHYEGFAYESANVPGLLIIPSMIPISVQRLLLTKMLHRDLSNASHRTNVDLHYILNRPSHGKSFFACDKANVVSPKEPSIHKPISYNHLLNKKLRWMTLGGQYDWTRKVYPNEAPPAFPRDVKNLLLGLFPETDAQAAIVNLYSPGDTLSLHRDVSEECDSGLISLSIGCDCIFVIGFEDETTEKGERYAVLRLRSGDIVLMAGPSRYAWHGVPQIIPHTCPEELRHWPATSPSGDDKREGDDLFRQWTDWMASKRINLNVRQMRA